MMYDWTFHDDNLVNMYKSLSPSDQIIYNCDIQDLNWDKFIIIWAIGLRKFVLKDGLKRTSYGQKKLKIFRVVHYIVAPLYLYSLWKVFTFCLFIVGTVFSFVLPFINCS